MNHPPSIPHIEPAPHSGQPSLPLLLILDYFRRKGWIFAAAGVLELALGWSGGHIGGKTHDLWTFQFQVAIIMGAFLLSFDLQRGMARAVSALPLTPRQIGRAWWLVAVGIPGSVFAALQFLGAGMYQMIHPEAVLDGKALGVSSLFLIAMMGSTFPFLFAMAKGARVAGWPRHLNAIGAVVWGLMLWGGYLYVQHASETPAELGVVFVLALGLTGAGWFMGERLVRMRASFRRGTQIVSRRRGAAQAPTGYGGIPLLIATTCLRALAVGLAMIVVLMLAFWIVEKKASGWWEVMTVLPGMSLFPVWFVLVLSLLPAWSQVRHLRSMPVSATAIAWALMAMVLMPLAGLEALMTGVAWLMSGATPAAGVMRDFIQTLPYVGLCLAFVAWQAMGIWSYMLLVATMSLAQAVPVLMKEWLGFDGLPAGLSAAIGMVVLALSFWVIRWSLLRSSRAYRSQPNIFAGMAAGGR